jgi:hypothetical protein
MFKIRSDFETTIKVGPCSGTGTGNEIFWEKKTLKLEVNQQLITGFKLDYLKLELDLISRTGTGT